MHSRRIHAHLPVPAVQPRAQNDPVLLRAERDVLHHEVLLAARRRVHQDHLQVRGVERRPGFQMNERERRDFVDRRAVDQL